MKYKIHKNGNDHHNIEFIGTPHKGSGFIGHDGVTIGLTRCPICGKENYAMAVIDGVCAWCGFNVHEI